MKRVLLTGASGFVGRQVVAPLLASGFDVHSNSRKPLGWAGIREHSVDLFDEKSVSALLAEVRASHLIHLAWYTKPPEYWQSSLNEDWERHSAHLFDHFVRNGGERIIGAGTCAEYEWGSAVLTEDGTPTKPVTAYGKAKLSLFQRGTMLAQQSGTGVAWARFFFLFGPHERRERFVPSLIDALLRGEVAECRNGDLERDFLYVEDAGAALAALSDSRVTGAVNVASGVGIRLGKIAEAIGTEMGLEGSVKITRGAMSADQPAAIVANVDRLSREVGWTQRHDLTESIRKTISWQSANRGSDAV